MSLSTFFNKKAKNGLIFKDQVRITIKFNFNEGKFNLKNI